MFRHVLAALLRPLPSHHQPLPATVGGPVRRRWRTITDYPDPARPFEPTSTFDTLRELKTTIRLFRVMFWLLIAILVAAMAGIAFPTWTIQTVAGAAGFGMMVAVPPARYALTGMVLTGVAGKWARGWEEAGLPLTRLWAVIAAPVSRSVYARWVAVLDGDTSAHVDGGVDPRLVWWLEGRQFSVEQMAAYRELGVSALDAVALHSAELSPDEWAALQQGGVTEEGTVQQIIVLAEWARSGRASLHPSQFITEATIPARDMETCAPVLAAWMNPETRHAGWRPFRFDMTRMRVPSPESINGLLVAGRTVRDWVDATGLLSPYFIAAGIAFEEAQALVADPAAAPRVEDLVFLAAWASPPTT